MLGVYSTNATYVGSGLSDLAFPLMVKSARVPCPQKPETNISPTSGSKYQQCDLGVIKSTVQVMSQNTAPNCAYRTQGHILGTVRRTIQIQLSYRP